MQRRTILTCLIVFLGLISRDVEAQDAYFHVPVLNVTFTDGAAPELTSARAYPRRGSWRHVDLLQPRVLLEGSGEAYYYPSAEGLHEPARFLEGAVVVRLASAQDVRGRLLLPKEDGSGMVSRTFVIPAARATAEAARAFYQARWEYYTTWAGAGVAGAAWFRQQAQDTQQRLATLGAPASATAERRPPWWRRQGSSDLEETYALWSGGRALSENLQLDRLLPPLKETDLTVDIASLPGIATASLDWKALLPNRAPVADALAAFVPDDQHALFFPTLHAFLQLIDEANNHGTPVLQALEPRVEDAHTRARYERQLCLGTGSLLARLLGPTVVSSVAITGSDPYLRAGSDVAMLFETRDPAVLHGFVSAKHTAALQEYPAVTRQEGEVQGLRYTAVVSPDRLISSYLAVHDKVVMVTNSLAQLRRLAETIHGARTALAASDEYRFFRARYPRTDSDETAFLLLTDATIRRWCSATWRIADSRRTRMAAALASLQAQALPALVQGTVQTGPLKTPPVPEAGSLHMTPRGPVSTTYGSLDFLTPIIELPISKVTPEEAQAYERFRTAYQQNWRQFFDPIALRFSLQPERVGFDLTVMPLIANTEYRDFIALTRNAALRPSSGDPHPEALWHFVMALNPEAPLMQQFGSTAGGMIPGLKTRPLAWLGNALAVYVDDDPHWPQRLHDMKTSGSGATWLRSLEELPAALHGEVKDALGLTAFLTAVRVFVEQAAPGMTRWETRMHHELPYVKVSPSERAMTSLDGASNALALYYAASGEALVISLSEALLQRALERQTRRGTGAKASPEGQGQDSTAPTWLGTHLALRLARQTLTVLTASWDEEIRQENQTTAWLNLPILNEWKRLFPQADPVQLHEKLWGVTLLCPGGGTYVWDATWQTMASTVYGHPAAPQAGPGLPSPLAAVLSAAFGLTFEHEGLRVRAEMTRSPGKP